VLLEHAGEVLAGELAALIGIEYLGRTEMDPNNWTAR